LGFSGETNRLGGQDRAVARIAGLRAIHIPGFKLIFRQEFVRRKNCKNGRGEGGGGESRFAIWTSVCSPNDRRKTPNGGALCATAPTQRRNRTSQPDSLPLPQCNLVLCAVVELFAATHVRPSAGRPRAVRRSPGGYQKPSRCSSRTLCSANDCPPLSVLETIDSIHWLYSLWTHVCKAKFTKSIVVEMSLISKVRK